MVRIMERSSRCDRILTARELPDVYAPPWAPCETGGEVVAADDL
jgi:hypothetical protein